MINSMSDYLMNNALNYQSLIVTNHHILMNHPHLKKVILENRPFRVGHYISEGFHLFSKNIGSFVAFSLLSVFILSAVGGIPLVGGWVSKFAIMPVLAAGIYLAAHEVYKGKRVEFGDHFLGFRYILPLALASMAISVITTAATLPFWLANKSLLAWVWNLNEFSMAIDLGSLQSSFPGFQSWKLLLLFPVIYLAIAYSWTRLFILFYDLTVWDAMEASRQFISKSWVTYLLFAIVLGLIGLGGLAGLLIGVFFTYPAMLCINYVAFADMTQLQKAEAEESYINIKVK